MASPRSDLLCLVTGIPLNVLTTCYVSPGGITTLVKEWVLVNNTAGNARLELFLRRGAQSIHLTTALTAAFNAPQVSSGRNVVLEAGDELQVLSTAVTAASFAAFGFRLQAP